MSRRTPQTNALFYGDNLHILRSYIEDESIDLVYLDPPFNSNATYNVLFRAPGGEASQAQIEAFDDTWHWNDKAEKAIVSVKGGGNVGVGMIRDLIATVDREKARVGILLSLEDPTTTMRREASAAGLYKTDFLGDFPKIQILTVEDLFQGKRPHLPWIDPSVFRKAKRESTEQQKTLDL